MEENIEINDFWIKYITVPIEVFGNETLDKTDMVIFSIIHLMDKNNHCWASNEYIANILNLSKTSVSVSISKLEKQKYIIRNISKGNRRVLRINPNFVKIHSSYSLQINERITTNPNKEPQQNKDSQQENSETALSQVKGRFNSSLSAALTQVKDNNINRKEMKNLRTSSSKEEECKQFSLSESNCPLPSPRNSSRNSPHKLNRRILTKAAKLRSLSIIKRYQEVPIKELRISPPVRELLEHWSELKLYLPKEHTKAFMDGVTKLKKLLSGTLFGQQFNIDEIKASMGRFSLAALDPDFEPSKPVYKKILSKMSPSDFIENLYSVGEKSYFLKYTKEEPLPRRDIENLLADKYPTTTKQLMNLYREKVLSNSRIKFNTKEENCFIRASQMLHKFYKDNASQINYLSIPTDSEKVQYLWEALVADVGEGSTNIRKITPGWFCSDTTFHHRYPAYLTQQGVLFFEEDTDSLSSFNNRKEDIDPFGLYD